MNKQRSHRNVYLYRLWNATGAWNSLYLGSFFGYAYLQYMSSFHNLRYHSIAKIAIVGPVFVGGYALGALSFGNFSESKHLLRHFNTYRKEFRAAKIEALYS